MPAFQVALFKLKPDADPALVQEWLAVSRTIPEKIPCVRRLVAGQPAASFEHVAKGWDMAAFIEFDSAESVTEFHGHPAHA
ncbi:hypothetical protein EKO04_007707 [Ascochyta lentis]|uniref:Stress-response A/B barrel domain-containing protein n=1 Tax=Ascochyta lentis TaxID=205686 RepID=A0A8H7MF94_9PLEO|nr:hypothetical protein EKO04_007707 [Ascochyta lentis]